MIESRDAELTKLFAEEERALPEMEFMKQLLMRVERIERRRRIYTTVILIALLSASALTAPWIAEKAAMLFQFGKQGINTIDALCRSPISWIVGAALLIAFTPVIYVLRIGRLD